MGFLRGLGECGKVEVMDGTMGWEISLSVYGGNTYLIRLICLGKLFGLISLTLVYLSGLFFMYCCLFSPLSVNT